MRRRLLLQRHPGDAVRAALAVATLVLVAVAIHRDQVGTLETDVFRVANDLPGVLFPPLWGIMQLGNLGAVPVVAAGAAVSRRFRLAAQITLTGVGVWLLAKVVKQMVQRGRPAELLPDVHIHGAAALGRGYLSGHTAVAFAMATLIAPYLPRGPRRLVWATALTVGAARVYVGSHLPLDVMGGAALGWGVASVMHLLLGAPSCRPSLASVRRALADLGLAVTTLQSVDADGRHAAPFVATTAQGERLYVKVIPRDRRDHDLIYRTWLAIASRGTRRPRYTAPGEQAEQEAAVQLAAAAAGVRTPALVAVGSSPSGTGVVVNRWVAGHPIDVRSDDGTALADLHRQVALLRDARISHGRLVAANVLVDDADRVSLVDFGRARVAATDEALAADADAVLALLGSVADAAPPPAAPTEN